MDKLIILHATEYELEKKRIEETYTQEGVLYVLDAETKLSSYLDYLYEFGLKTKVLCRLRICKEQKFQPDSVTLRQEGKDYHPSSMSELLRDINDRENAQIIIEKDDRTLFADILQQFIYIDYPLERVNMRLRREFKDAEKTERFMERITELHKGAEKAVELLGKLAVEADSDSETAKEMHKLRTKALTAYTVIQAQIAKARDVEMRIAAVASKKTGKSVIVNSMLGMELAPTSLELATPNTCIYRRSPDNRYHVKYVNQDDERTYDSPDGVNQFVGGEFRKAQAEKTDGFTIPDMDISYVSDGNNFNTFTIYDTPGPDAAGTNHRKSATKYMECADVAVFAIDYAKYLTESEEIYLRAVKDHFAKNEKFHSLIFTINKMDCALQDNGIKSRTKSMDFIRNRLRDIDPNYGDCVVFGTSALDYFMCLELEKAAQADSPWAVMIRPLCGNDVDLYKELRVVIDNLNDAECDDEDLIGVLSNLDTEAGRLKNKLCYRQINLQTIKNYSGMPQMMDYVAYIAKSKAREEIVNKITNEIDTQRASLQTIIDSVSNIREMIDADESRIAEIKRILGDYEAEINPLLAESITEEDFHKAYFQGGVLDTVINDASKKGFPVSLDVLFDWVVKRNEIPDPHEAEDYIWARYKTEQFKRLTNASGKVLSDEDARKVSLSEAEIKGIIEDYLNANREKYLKGEQNEKGVRECLTIVQRALQSLVQDRQQQLYGISKAFQERLDQRGIDLTLPEIPVFDAVVSDPKISDALGTISLPSLASAYDPLFESFNWFQNLFYGLLHNSENGRAPKDPGGHGRKYVKVSKLKKEDIEKEIACVHERFIHAIRDSGIYDIAKGDQADLTEMASSACSEIKEQVSATMKACENNLQMFRSSIDRREYYEKHMEELELMSNLIGQVEAASCDFLTVWGEIIEPNGQGEVKNDQ